MSRVTNSERPRNFVCTAKGCGKAFVRSEHLSRHSLNHRPNQVYSCDECHKQFVRRDLLQRHKKRHEKGMWMRNVGGVVNVQPKESSNAENEPSRSASPAQNSKTYPTSLSNTSSNALLPPSSFASEAISEYSSSLFNKHEQTKVINSSSFDAVSPGLAHVFPLQSGQIPQSGSSRNASDASYLCFDPLFASDSNFEADVESKDTDWSWNDFPSVTALSLDHVHHQQVAQAYPHSGSLTGLTFDNQYVNNRQHFSNPRQGQGLNVWEVVKARLLAELTSADPMLLSSAFFEPANLETFWDAFFIHYHPQFPFVHRPTLNPAEAPPLLVLSILALGATMAPDLSLYRTSLEIHDCLRGLIFNVKDYPNNVCVGLTDLGNKTGGFHPPAPLWCLQTLLLMQAQGKMFATRKHHESAHIIHGAIISLMRCGSVTRAAYKQLEGHAHTASFRSHTEWIAIESSRRTVFFAFLMDAQHAAFFGHVPSLSVNDVQLPLPCDDALWECASLSDLRQGLSRTPGSLQFLTVLNSLMKGRALPSVCSTYSKSILLHGLFSIVAHLKSREATILGTGISCSQINSLQDASPLSPGSDWRQILSRAVTLCFQPSTTTLESPCIRSMRTLQRMAQMLIYVNILDFHIMVQTHSLHVHYLSSTDISFVETRMKAWVHDSNGKIALREALLLIRETIFIGRTYQAREDNIPLRPWCLYHAVLLCWVYSHMASINNAHAVTVSSIRSRKMPADEYVTRFLISLEVGEPSFEHVADIHNLVTVVRDCLRGCRWELLQEAYKTLDRLTRVFP